MEWMFELCPGPPWGMANQNYDTTQSFSYYQQLWCVEDNPYNMVYTSSDGYGSLSLHLGDPLKGVSYLRFN
jgi:hypothetical protein